MTEAEVWLKYGPDALHAAAAESRNMPAGPRRVAFLMERFGRNWHHVDHVLRVMEMGEDPLNPVARFGVEVALAARQVAARVRALLRV